MKKIIQWVLLAVVVLGVGVEVVRNRAEPTVQKTVPIQAVESTNTASANEKTAVTVTYFSSNVRCVSCRKIEALTRNTIETQFAEQMNSRQLVFETINIDLPENKHYVEEYELSFKTVLIAYVDGTGEKQWRKMDKVWELLSNEDQFEAYIAEGITSALSQISS